MPELDRLVVPADYLSSDVQFGQRNALIEIVEKQNGHSFVVGAAGVAGLAGASLFAARIIMKMTKATIKKLITLLRNKP